MQLCIQLFRTKNHDHEDFAYQNTTFTINLKQTKVNYMFFGSNLCSKIPWQCSFNGLVLNTYFVLVTITNLNNHQVVCFNCFKKTFKINFSCAKYIKITTTISIEFSCLILQFVLIGF